MRFGIDRGLTPNWVGHPTRSRIGDLYPVWDMKGMGRGRNTAGSDDALLTAGAAWMAGALSCTATGHLPTVTALQTLTEAWKVSGRMKTNRRIGVPDSISGVTFGTPSWPSYGIGGFLCPIETARQGGPDPAGVSHAPYPLEPEIDDPPGMRRVLGAAVPEGILGRRQVAGLTRQVGFTRMSQNSGMKRTESGAPGTGTDRQ